MIDKLDLMEVLKSGCIFGKGTDDFVLGFGELSRSETPQTGVRGDGVSIYAPDFFLRDPKPWWNFKEGRKVSRELLLEGLMNFEAMSEVLDWEEPNFEWFRRAFLDLKSRFSSQELKKGVPVVFKKAEFPLDVDEGRILGFRVGLLRQLLLNGCHPSVWIYGVWDHREGILGGTPELLLESLGNGRVRTTALAGTRLKLGVDFHDLPLIRESLFKDPKERNEHQWVICGIQEALARYGQTKIGETHVLDLPSLFHLKTEIELIFEPGFLKGLSGNPGKQPKIVEEILEIVKSLHPTPALGAFPKEIGWEWLNQFPGDQDRLRFGAPFGVWRRENDLGFKAQFVVGIRNLQWKGRGVFLGAGCGVVADSVLEREWEEISGKMRSVEKFFERGD